MVAELKETIKILLVEDEKNTADAIVRFLERKDFVVDVAYDLESGIEKFSKNSTNYKLVLLDILLKGQKVFPLLKKIKEESPQTKVIMISAYDTEEHIKEAKALGADDFIAKPFMSKYLESILLSKIYSSIKKENY